MSRTPCGLVMLDGSVKTSFTFLWVLPVWGGVAGAYFLAAYVYLWKKARINLWKIWWQTNTDNLKTERRFAAQIRKFPRWNLLYQLVKWGSLAVVVGYLACVFVYLSRR